MVREIQASEAKTHLSRLLDDLERGDTIVITRHGRPIAHLTQHGDLRREAVETALARIAQFRQRSHCVTTKDLLSSRDEGRK